MNFLPKLRPFSIYSNRLIFPARTCSTGKRAEGEIPKNILEEQGLITGHLQKGNGKIYDKKPFKMTLEANKKYSWCLCGHSKSQPICDGTHKNIHLKLELKSVRFAVAKSGDYWLCNCKQTKNRPFCDGTHKTAVVQEK